MAHITVDELRKRLDEGMLRDGTANRCLWVGVRRPALVAFPGRPGDGDRARVARAFRGAAESARGAGELILDAESVDLWRAVYPSLAADRGNGPFGSSTSRAEAQTIRLALLYAVVDESRIIRPRHLESALAFWSYVERSALLIFGEATGDPDADRIEAAVRGAGAAGLTSTEIIRLFSGHRDRTRLARSLGVLARLGRVRQVEAATATGRRPVRWVSTGADPAKEAKEVPPGEGSSGVSSLLSLDSQSPEGGGGAQ